VAHQERFERERKDSETYSTKTKTRYKALVEETIGEKGNCWDCIGYGKNIV